MPALDFSKGGWSDYPYDAFDADDVSICTDDFRVYWLDTDTGVAKGHFHPFTESQDRNLKGETRQFKPPIRVVDGHGREVTCQG